MHYDDPKIAKLLRDQGVEPMFVVRPKRKRNNEESRSQQAVIKWWATACREFGVPEMLLFAIPNGGWRDPVGAKILKREGQRNGVADLFLSVARGKQHGLYIEMKAEHGVVSSDQSLFLTTAHAQGYAVTVAYSTEQAMAAVRDYLNG